MRSTRVFIVIAVLALSLGGVSGAPRKEKLKRVNLNGFRAATTGAAYSGRGYAQAQWLPPAYWRARLRQTGRLYPSQVAQMMRTYDKYEMVAVARRLKVGEGMYNYLSKSVVKRHIRVTWTPEGGDPVELKRVRMIDPKIESSFERDRPFMAKRSGAFGRNCQYILFERKNAAGELIADPYEPGELFIELLPILNHPRMSFKITCPINSLFAPRECASCEKEAEGLWKYCPWCGEQLPD